MLDIPVTARVLTSGGAPVGGQLLNFNTTDGPGTFTPPTATTDANGNAFSTLHISSLTAQVNAVLCAAAGGLVCPPLRVFAVASSGLQLQPVAGTQQAISIGQSFTPVRVRVLDVNVPPNPVFGVLVTFNTMWMLLAVTPATVNPGSEIGWNFAERVLLGSSQSTVTSDVDGYAGSIPPIGPPAVRWMSACQPTSATERHCSSCSRSWRRSFMLTRPGLRPGLLPVHPMWLCLPLPR